MRRNKAFSIIILTIFIFQLLSNGITFAANASQNQTPPTNVKVPVTGISYNSTTGKYQAEVDWTKAGAVPDDTGDVTVSPGMVTDMGYYLFTKDTKNVSGAFNKYPTNIAYSDSNGPITSFSLDKDGSNKDLSSGTIYAVKMQAYHTHTYTPSTTTTLRVDTSIESNIAYFMTDLSVQVKPAGTNALQIVWDDVWDGASRIGYEIHISESKNFATDNTLVVTNSNIAASGPVIPSNGKLTYKVTGSFLKDSTLYYVKIKPIISDTKVIYKTESDTVVGYTNIISTITKVSDGWWKLVWNAVTDSTLSGSQKVTYTIKKGLISAGTGAVLEEVAETTNTQYYLNITDSNYFYMIIADIKDGYGNRILDEYGYGIKSDKLYAVEGAVASTPTVPDLKSIIYADPTDTTSTVLYSDSTSPWLTSKQSTIAWTPPTLADGITVDTGIVYDIYLVTDSSQLDLPTTKPKYPNISAPTQLTYNGKLLAYTYTLPSLTANTVYYVKIVAKKSYTVNNNGVLSTQEFSSLPALKVIITPTNGSIDQPVAPAKPPLKVKVVKDSSGNTVPDSNGNDTLDVGKNNAWIEWANTWGLASDNTPVDLSVTDATYDESKPLVTYPANTTFDIGYVEYSSTLDYSTLSSLTPQVQNIPNTTTGNAFTILYNLTGLKANTTYVVWVRAYNPNIGLMSEPSDPLIVVTKPDYTTPVEKPIVPTFNENVAGDTSVGLKWDENTSYTYYIKYSTSDNISSAQNSVTVKPSDLAKSPLYTITGLSQDTLYYFWIQADSTGTKLADGLSSWSDSYPVKTLPYNAPDTPNGFGVKNTSNAIGKNNITYEWIQVSGISYTLEIASDTNYKNSTKYVAGKVSEFNVTGLMSNHRYFARLYAIDTSKSNLSSLPTQSVTAKTLTSSDEYDSNSDTSTVITGDIVVSDGTVNGVDIKSITGSNADRFVEQIQTDKILDYVVDFTDTSSTKKELKMSNKILDSLLNLKENIILDLGFCKYTIKPGLLDANFEAQLKNRLGDFNLYMDLSSEDLTSTQDNVMIKKGLTYKTKDTTISVSAVNGADSIIVSQFAKPVIVSYKYTPMSSYTEGTMSGYYYNDTSSEWVQLPTTAKYNQTVDYGYINYNLSVPNKTAVLSTGSSTATYEDVSGSDRYSQISVMAAKYNLKSVDPTYFRPNDNATVAEAVKIIMDVMNYSYDENYASTALKAKLISQSDLANIDGDCSKKTAYQMIDRLYEIKTGSKADSRDLTEEDSQPITRADFMGELYIILNKIGEV